MTQTFSSPSGSVGCDSVVDDRLMKRPAAFVCIHPAASGCLVNDIDAETRGRFLKHRGTLESAKSPT